jgi:hypothetical protein
MAAIAVCYETPTRFARYTVSSSASIPKGSLLAVTSPNTATLSLADNDVAGGVAWMEKDSSDASTEIVAALDGVWGVYSSTAAGPITCGYDVVLKGVNTIGPYTTLDDEKGYVLGKALATVSSAASVLVKTRVNV